jgi:uncharacterized protein
VQQRQEIDAALIPEPPPGSWLMKQTWQHVLFAHWPVPADDVRPLVPAPLEVDFWAGQAWVSVVTLRASGVRLRFVPPVPLLSTLHQVNLRTYVHYQGEPGVYFITIDTDHLPAALGARLLYRLPYYYARIVMRNQGKEVSWASRRATPGTEPAEFRATYRPTGELFTPGPATLDAWLLNRFRLFMVTGGGQPKRGEIRHSEWHLHNAALAIEHDSLSAARGVRVPSVAPVTHYAAQESALFWPLRDA